MPGAGGIGGAGSPRKPPYNLTPSQQQLIQNTGRERKNASPINAAKGAQTKSGKSYNQQTRPLPYQQKPGVPIGPDTGLPFGKAVPVGKPGPITAAATGMLGGGEAKASPPEPGGTGRNFKPSVEGGVLKKPGSAATDAKPSKHPKSGIPTTHRDGTTSTPDHYKSDLTK